MYLFVYGTLKQGFSRHHAIEGLNFIGPGRAFGALVNNRNMYPAYMPFHEHGGAVFGEVYETQEDEDGPLIKALDRIEGYPFLFGRSPRPIALENDGSMIMAIAYHGAAPQFANMPVIEDGIWTIGQIETENV